MVNSKKGEKLGVVSLSSGTINMYMPTMSDIVDIAEPLGSQIMLFKLAARSCRISYEEFLDWGLEDGMLVITKMNQCISSSLAYLGSTK